MGARMLVLAKFMLLLACSDFRENSLIRFFHRSHNTVHFGGVFALQQWIISSLKHDTVPRVNNLYCFYVKNPPKRIALWDRENSQWLFSGTSLGPRQAPVVLHQQYMEF